MPSTPGTPAAPAGPGGPLGPTGPLCRTNTEISFHFVFSLKFICGDHPAPLQLTQSLIVGATRGERSRNRTWFLIMLPLKLLSSSMCWIRAAVCTWVLPAVHAAINAPQSALEEQSQITAWIKKTASARVSSDSSLTVHYCHQDICMLFIEVFATKFPKFGEN